MKKNMGIFDRVLRILAAVVLAILFFTGKVTGVWGIVILVFAAVFLLTSLVSVCPAYMPFGISTCKKK